MERCPPNARPPAAPVSRRAEGMGGAWRRRRSGTCQVRKIPTVRKLRRTGGKSFSTDAAAAVFSITAHRVPDSLKSRSSAFERRTLCRSATASKCSRRNSRNSRQMPRSPLCLPLVSAEKICRFSGGQTKTPTTDFFVSSVKRQSGYALHTSYTTGIVMATSPSAEKRMISTFRQGVFSIFEVVAGMIFQRCPVQEKYFCKTSREMSFSLCSFLNGSI